MVSIIGLKGVVLGYRRGLKTQNTNYVYLKFKGFESNEKASQLIGRKVMWTGKKGVRVMGSIVRVHGGKGVVIARFRKPLPGQAIGSEVTIVG